MSINYFKPSISKKIEILDVSKEAISYFIDVRISSFAMQLFVVNKEIFYYAYEIFHRRKNTKYDTTNISREKRYLLSMVSDNIYCQVRDPENTLFARVQYVL